MDKNDTQNAIIKTIYRQLGITMALLDGLLKQKSITYYTLEEELCAINRVLKRIGENATRMDNGGEYLIPNCLKYLPDIFACPDKKEFFYSDDEYEDVERGCIGHLRGDHGKHGDEFFTTWFDHQPHLNTEAFKQEFNAVVNNLREGLLMSRSIMRVICEMTPESKNGDWYYFTMITQSYEYYIRCFPEFGTYNFYIYCYQRDKIGGHI